MENQYTTSIFLLSYNIEFMPFLVFNNNSLCSIFYYSKDVFKLIGCLLEMS